MVQRDFWDLYKKASMIHGIGSMLTATKPFNLVTMAFIQAYLKIVARTNSEPPKHMIIGQSRRKVTEN
jgi:hypothetical protein